MVRVNETRLMLNSDKATIRRWPPSCQVISPYVSVGPDFFYLFMYYQTSPSITCHSAIIKPTDPGGFGRKEFFTFFISQFYKPKQYVEFDEESQDAAPRNGSALRQWQLVQLTRELLVRYPRKNKKRGEKRGRDRYRGGEADESFLILS